MMSIMNIVVCVGSLLAFFIFLCTWMMNQKLASKVNGLLEENRELHTECERLRKNLASVTRVTNISWYCPDDYSIKPGISGTGTTLIHWKPNPSDSPT